MTVKLNKIVFEEGTKTDDEIDYIDLENSLDDMIKFTETITRRKSPLGSQESLKTEMSRDDCKCECHDEPQNLQFINEKTQTDSQILNAQESHGMSAQQSDDIEQLSEYEISVKPSEKDQLTLVKSSGQLLKQIYTEIKVCRCLEKYRNKKQQQQNSPVVESLIRKEEIQQQGVMNDDENVLDESKAVDSVHNSSQALEAAESVHNASQASKAVEDDCLHVCSAHCPKTCKYHCPPGCKSKVKVEKKVSEETVKSKTLKPIISLIDLDAADAENDKKKPKKNSKNDFVDVDLVRCKI